jgi:hypothetical protein
MEGLDNRLIILKLVNGYVHHRTDQTRVVGNVHVDLWAWERNLPQSLLHLWIPLFHELIELRHVLRVVDCWGRS